MAYRALIPGELIAADPATRFLLDRYHSTIWYGPGKHLVHYMIRRGEYLNVVAIVPCTEQVERDWSAPATAEDLVADFADWDDRVPAMLSKAKDDVSVWALYRRRRDPVWLDGRVALLGDACHAMLPYQAQGASQAMEDAAVLAEELGAAGRGGIDTALAPLRAAPRQARGRRPGRLAAEHGLLPPARRPRAARERDEKLRRFQGESDVSYDWLWRGSPLNDPDDESVTYPFAR